MLLDHFPIWSSYFLPPAFSPHKMLTLYISSCLYVSEFRIIKALADQTSTMRVMCLYSGVTVYVEISWRRGYQTPSVPTTMDEEEEEFDDHRIEVDNE